MSVIAYGGMPVQELQAGDPELIGPYRVVRRPSDVFSLGAVLAFAATGEGPFGAGSSAALIYRLVHNSPDLDRVPLATRPLIERCLDKNPGGRPSPRELLAELGGAGLAPGWLPGSLIGDIGPPRTSHACSVLRPARVWLPLAVTLRPGLGPGLGPGGN